MNKISNDKVKILNAISVFYGFKRKAEFARFLNIPQTTLSSWYSRNTFDIDVISEKCTDIDLNRLFRHGVAQKIKEDNPMDEPGNGYQNNNFWERLIAQRDAKNMELAEQIGVLKEQIRQLKLKRHK